MRANGETTTYNEHVEKRQKTSKMPAKRGPSLKGLLGSLTPAWICVSSPSFCGFLVQVPQCPFFGGEGSPKTDKTRTKKVGALILTAIGLDL